jgi:hypothetical protein
VLLTALIWLVAAPASADPGRPGLDDASKAVYPEAPPPGTEQAPGGQPGHQNAPTNEVVNDQESQSPNASGGSVPPPSGPSAPSPSSTSSLPFTGLVAPLLLAIGLLALGLGIGARKLHARGAFG